MYVFVLAELLKLADYYGEEDLKRRCEQQLRFLITEDNFSQIYSASFQYNSKVSVYLIGEGESYEFDRIDFLRTCCSAGFA